MTITDPRRLIPDELQTTEFVLRPIRADDAALDHAAVMDTRECLRLWEQSTWPEDDFTVEANRVDLVDLEERHAERRAYTYTVLKPDETECWGCVYVFPPEATFLAKSAVTPLGDRNWGEVDAVVYFWVRRPRMETGMDERLLAELRAWFTNEWKLPGTVYVTNEQFAQQVELIGRTDLKLEFELVEPGKPGRYLVFG